MPTLLCDYNYSSPGVEELNLSQSVEWLLAAHVSWRLATVRQSVRCVVTNRLFNLLPDAGETANSSACLLENIIIII